VVANIAGFADSIRKCKYPSSPKVFSLPITLQKKAFKVCGRFLLYMEQFFYIDIIILQWTFGYSSSKLKAFTIEVNT